VRPRLTASRRCRCQCPARRPTPGHLRYQPIELCVQLGDLCRESFVTASHRTEGELGCRRYVARVICEAEACSHGNEFLRREPAQTVAESLRCRHPQALELALAARVLAFIAERRAARKARIISAQPSALLGTPDVSPANTARAALSASEESDLRLRHELRRLCFGRSTFSTSMP